MYKGKASALFAKYALPQMIGLLFNSVYLIVDGIFIGNRLGRDAMAAAAVAVPLIEILIAISIAVSSGAGVLISNRLGRKEQKQARQTFNLSMLVLAMVSLVIVILGSLFIRRLAGVLGATPDILEDAVAYLRYIVSFAPFLLFSFLLGGLARNDGCPKLAMFALAFGSVSNIVLDYVFMYPLNMGISGAALATALGPIFSVLILLPHFVFKRGNLYITRCRLRLHEVKQIFTLGVPSFLMEFTIGIITFLYNAAIIRNGFGEIGLASYLIIGYLMLIILTVFLGMAEGLQPVFSYFSGMHAEERNQTLRAFSVKVFVLAGILSYLLILLCSKQFIAVFAPGDPELIAFTHRRSILYFSGFFLAGYNILMISFWQSVKRSKQALAVSIIRSLVLPGILILSLPILFGSEAIWVCHTLSEVLTAAVAAAMWVGRRNRPVQKAL